MRLPLAGARAALLEGGRWSILLAFAALPFAKPAINIFLFLGLLASLAGTGVLARVRDALGQPVVRGTLLWFGVLVASTAYATDNPQRWSDLGVYKALLYPFIIATLLTTQAWRDRCLHAFAAAAVVILAMSWAQMAGLEPPHDLVDAFEAYRYTVFNDYSQQGLQFLMLAAICATFLPRVSSARLRGLLVFIMAASVTNVLFLLQSRTAYLATVPLLLYWSWRWLSPRIGQWRALAAGAVLLAVVGGLASLAPRVQQRMQMASNDITQYVDKREATSLGIRLELWKQTLAMAADAPLLGHGMGGWLREFRARTASLPDYESFRMGHPHHETLLILAEQGAIGLLIFLGLLAALARRIWQAPLPQRDFFASLFLLFVTAGLANSMLIDFVNRHGFLMLLACFPLAAASSTRES